MKKIILLCLAFASVNTAFSQQLITGKVYCQQTNEHLNGVSIYNQRTGSGSITNNLGQYALTATAMDTLRFSFIGYKTKEVIFSGNTSALELVKLVEDQINLQAISISASRSANLGTNQIDQLSLKISPVKNAQDLLKTISGVFIAQHAGGGKAEQIFARGFDNDHGTDFAVYLDDVPVNLPDHAHGQGYADMHFIIPELIKEASYYKGPFEVKNGNFAVSGAARLQTINQLDKNALKIDYGNYDFSRGLLMLNLTPENKLLFKEKESAYIAIEGTLNKGFFESSQNLKRINSFFKYSTTLNNHTNIKLLGTYFKSTWDASGQIPLRAIQSENLSWFDAIDDTEGGSTARSNISITSFTGLNSTTSIKNHLYYTSNNYQLFSNFTFFLNDSINGDMIEQIENRDLIGYNFDFEKNTNLFQRNLKTEAGIGFRSDYVRSGLNKAKQRDLIESLNRYNIEETAYQFFIQETYALNQSIVLQTGTRLDIFSFKLTDLSNNITESRLANRWSPKLSCFYNISPKVQFFTKAGYGFHSNYAQAAIKNKAKPPLPRAKGIDIGSQLKIRDRWLINLTGWILKTDAELIFVADGAEFENKGSAKRLGIDFTSKYQLTPTIWVDINGNFSHGTLLDAPVGENSIPSAPRFTSTGGLTYIGNNGFKGMINYRYMGERPLSEDEKIWADQYFLVDLSAQYNRKKYQFGLTIENLLNTKWMEAVFYDESRLQFEKEPVDDIHFTPGIPFFLKGSLTYFF